MIRVVPPCSSKLLCSLKLTNGRVNILKPLQTATICRKEEMDPVILESKPKPWKWETVPFFNALGFIGFDRNINRFDENTVVISVEGNIGVGKTTFAKALSNALGTRFYSEPDLDLLYKREDGFDYRTLNYKLPESCHFMDHKLFYLNPEHPAASGFLSMLFKLNAWQYVDVLSHVLSTGQGVVTDRSPWSHWAVQTAAHKMKLGHCGKSFLRYCQHCRDEATPVLLRPHVVIYLDAPAEVCLERVKKRGVAHEVNSKAMCPEFLEHIEFCYKDHILPELEAHSEVLVYDWQDPPDLDLVIDDLSRLNVHERPRGEKMEDWREPAEMFYDLLRRQYTVNRWPILNTLNQDPFWAPDMLISMEEIDHRTDVLTLLKPPHDEVFTAKTPKQIFNLLFQPDFCRGTYLQKIDRFFKEPRPKRPQTSHS